MAIDDGTSTFLKFPGEIVDVKLAFSDWLAEWNDAIATFTAGADYGLDVESATNVTDDVVVRVSGGVSGTDYLVAADAVTRAGRVKHVERTVQVRGRALKTAQQFANGQIFLDALPIFLDTFNLVLT